MGDLVLTAHIAATLFMTGVIWFVQVVHYRLMDGVGASGFVIYQGRHMRRTTWIVAPPMLIELATGLALAVDPGGLPVFQVWIGLALIGGIWISTATLQVPLHRRLEAVFDAAAHRRLLATNWIRVAGWSARAVLVLGWLRQAVS